MRRVGVSRADQYVKQVHTAKHAPEAHLVKGFLESQGIAAVVRGEFLTSGWGELPVDLCSVWIENDAQYDRANALLVAFFRRDFAREFDCLLGRQVLGEFFLGDQNRHG